MKTELLQKLPCALRPPIEEELQRLETENHRLTLANKCLHERIRLILIKKYGAKSEQLTDAQLQLLEDEPDVSRCEVELEAQLPEQEKAEAAKARKRGISLFWVGEISKTNWFDGGYAPPNPAPLAAAGVRGEHWKL